MAAVLAICSAVCAALAAGLLVDAAGRLRPGTASVKRGPQATRRLLAVAELLGHGRVGRAVFGLPGAAALAEKLRGLLAAHGKAATPQGALAVNYDRLAAPDVQNASLGSNSVLMLLRLLRLCGAKAVLLAGADGYKPGTPAYADSLLHAHTGRGAAFNTAMAGAIKACGLDVTFITPSEYAK